MKRILVLAFVILSYCRNPATAQYERINSLPTSSRGKPHLRHHHHPCDQSSCFPATGNLLIGRENNLHASSTCGTNGTVQYCIVSHLKDRKKCFKCNADSPTEQHHIRNVVHGVPNRTWWQSENGVENVTIQFDLEAEFVFTHLIIKFKTFRPAAMLIERSNNYGKTWNVYRYFAYNCEQVFPGVPIGTPVSLTDVTCVSKYSAVLPSDGGEVIYRSLNTKNSIEDPYSADVQNHVKITNLRLNFTRLHTLGDDLLDNRPEIRMKYYYGIQQMVIRGSCSCYGHAARCLPLDGSENRQDMVHGRCECTHNTTGLNCERCEDFYNDGPWKPAVGKETNACKPCNCNSHSKSCVFNQTVYDRSGRISGGVCLNCQDNTMGQNCELCKPSFYHDPSKDISERDACQPCDCDPDGSIDKGICDPRTNILTGEEAGRCHCKANVDGRRCDHCKNGFWNFDPNSIEGCQPCTCDYLGTIPNVGCDMVTGECTCKRYVTGRNCDACLPNYWGLSDDQDGCKPCNCDPGGSYDNSCDVNTGQCRCRPHIGGRTCDQPEQSFYTGRMDFLRFEAEYATPSDNCQVVIKEPNRDGSDNTWTGIGYMKVLEGSTLNFTIDGIRKSMKYDMIVRYEPIGPGYWENVKIDIYRDGGTDPNGPCRSWRPSDDNLWVQLPANARSAKVTPSICFEAGKTYHVIMTFVVHSINYPTPSVLIDSIVLKPNAYDVLDPLIPLNHMVQPTYDTTYNQYRCDDYYNEVGLDENIPSECEDYFKIVANTAFEGAQPCDCDPTGSKSLLCQNYGGNCPCKPNVVGRTCDRCAPGTYGFGSEGCTPCDCDGVGALDNFCDVDTGRCKCRNNTYGRTCGQCEPGFWNFPGCQRCECNGHTESCESSTGQCIECRDFTTGHNCDRCIESYYGDPRIGVDIPCRPCPCPGSLNSGHSYANSCSLDSVTQDVVCECFEGYAGSRCESCAENYYGNPEVPGGSCQPCDCKNNTDLSRPGNCDPQTGHCLQCLFNTDGPHCEFCKPNYFGNALRHDCTECRCFFLGTDSSAPGCDRTTGQCPCLPHVVGHLCNECEENHWRIGSGVGCDPCNCDPIGSYSARCNQYTGNCDCKPGFGGQMCNECQLNYWGDPNTKCFPCECDIDGSAKQQCDRKTGVCTCYKGIGGEKCDQCDRGYIGQAPTCSPCGECFDNWDLILHELKNKTKLVIDEASRIQKVGTTGVYSQEFNDMFKSLELVRNLIGNATVKGQDLDELDDLSNKLNETISNFEKHLNDVDQNLENVNEKVLLAEENMKQWKARTEILHNKSKELEIGANKLQEANVQGALNVTIQMGELSKMAENIANKEVAEILSEADRYRQNTEILIVKNKEIIDTAQEQSKEALERLNQKLKSFDKIMPTLNFEMCGDNVTDCSEVCGGAGCSSGCGGYSCDDGAITKTEQALNVAKEQSDKIKKYKDKADQLLRSMAEIKKDATEARANAQDAFNIATHAKNLTGSLVKNLTDVNNQIIHLLQEEQATPAMVLNLAQEVLSQNIHLEPSEIKKVTDKISTIVSSLTDSERILAETSMDLERAAKFEAEAKAAKIYAEEQKTLAAKVVQMLKDSEKIQEDVKIALDKAEQAVQLSENDLKEISISTQGAQREANETRKKVERLEASLADLKAKSGRNDFVIKSEISVEAGRLEEGAIKIEKDAEDLENKYNRAKENLNSRVNKSEGDILRSKKLLQRASKLTADTLTKFKDLEEMETVYKGNENTLNELESTIDYLTEQMEVHLKDIEKKAIDSRDCTT